MATWDESKRRKNIKNHGLDFEGCEAIWDNFTIAREDVRRAGLHIISLRKAEKYETRYYFAATKDYFKEVD